MIEKFEKAKGVAPYRLAETNVTSRAGGSIAMGKLPPRAD